jgi:DNA-binding response OmpR family regulator
LVVSALTPAGVAIGVARDGQAGLEPARGVHPDIVVLDGSLPLLDGIEVCRQLRTFSETCVVMPTARDSEIDRLIGLSVGADDSLVTPLFPSELVARVKAAPRRVRVVVAAESERVFGASRIDPLARRVWPDGQEIELSRIEYDVLDALSENPRITLRRDQLLDRVSGNEWFGDDHVIDVHLPDLRRRLGDDPRHARDVCTARGDGFRMGDGTVSQAREPSGGPTPGRCGSPEPRRVCV